MNRCLLLTISALCLSGCARRSGHADEDAKAGFRARMRIAFADGAAARSAQEEGLARGIAGYLGERAVLLWPGEAPVLGRPLIISRLGATGALDSATVMWTPLRLRIDSAQTFGLVYGVLSVSGKGSDGRLRTNLGRYQMAWQADSGQLRIKALMVNHIPVPALGTMPPGLDTLVVIERPDPDWRAAETSRPLAEADSLFGLDAAQQGAGHAFGEWLAPDGVTFGGDGELHMGPDAVSAELDAADSAAVWRFRNEFGALSSDGALGWTSGELISTPRQDAGAAGSQSWNYLFLWERQPDGRLKIIAASTNPRERPAPPERAPGS